MSHAVILRRTAGALLLASLSTISFSTPIVLAQATQSPTCEAALRAGEAPANDGAINRCCLVDDESAWYDKHGINEGGIYNSGGANFQARRCVPAGTPLTAGDPLSQPNESGPDVPVTPPPDPT